MTDEKICPFMSRPVVLDSVSNDTLTQNTLTLFEAVCIRERCMAWQPPCLNFEATGRCLIVHDCDDSGFMCHGGCRLIP